MEDEFRRLRSQLENYFAGRARDAIPACRTFDARTRHRLHRALDILLDRLEGSSQQTRDAEFAELERRKASDIERTKVTRPVATTTTGADVDIEGLRGVSEQLKQEEEEEL